MWKRQRVLISRIPKSEANEAKELEQILGDCKSLIYVLASINQVEKSIAPVDKGGYGNFLGIKNAEMWQKYLHTASVFFGNADYDLNNPPTEGLFVNQFKELANRYYEVKVIVDKIESDFEKEYEFLCDLFEEAKLSNDKRKAEEILSEAEQLGTCLRSDNLEFNIKRYIKGKSEVQFYRYDNGEYKYSLAYPLDFVIDYTDENGIDQGDFTLDGEEVQISVLSGTLNSNHNAEYEDIMEYVVNSFNLY